VLPPPERHDGTFRWLDAAAEPPPDFLPVTFDDPDTGRQLAVCRGFIVDAPEPDQGYHTGELGVGSDGEQECRVAHRGGMLRYQARDNGYQQLWARSGAAYQWAALDAIPERPLALSILWQNNRVPGDYVVRITTGEVIAFWLPCAIQDAQGWHLGKVNIRDGAQVPCYVQLAEREVGVYDGVVVLYARVP